jgi:hypothetical protein
LVKFIRNQVIRGTSLPIVWSDTKNNLYAL